MIQCGSTFHDKYYVQDISSFEWFLTLEITVPIDVWVRRCCCSAYPQSWGKTYFLVHFLVKLGQFFYGNADFLGKWKRAQPSQNMSCLPMTVPLLYSHETCFEFHWMQICCVCVCVHMTRNKFFHADVFSSFLTLIVQVFFSTCFHIYILLTSSTYVSHLFHKFKHRWTFTWCTDRLTKD